MLMIPPAGGDTFVGNSMGAVYESKGASLDIEHADIRQGYARGWSPVDEPVSDSIEEEVVKEG